MKKYTILLLCLINIHAFAQWKSYYPEKKISKKEVEKQDDRKNKHNFQNNLFLALKAKSLQDYSVALKYFQKCINLDNSQPVPFYESAIINNQEGLFDLAIDQIEEAIKLDNSNRWYILAYADILLSNNNFKQAAYQYKKLIKKEPGNEELYLILAETYIYDNDLIKSINVYNDLEKYKGIDRIISMQKHKLYRELNNLNGAISELVNLLKEFSDDIEAMEILTELYLLNDEKEKAFELFKKIAVLAPENGRIHLTLADYYRQSGDINKSYKELKLAFESKKLGFDTKIKILVSYYQLIAINNEMRSQAYELANILIVTHPNKIEARGVYADILYTDNKLQEAKEEYLLVLDKDKNNRQIWSQVLFIQAEQSEFEEMQITSEEALQYFPSEPLFYYFNGVSNKWFKKYEDAILSLETGLEFLVDNKMLLLEFYSSLADSYHSINKHNLSDEYYEKALAIDPENTLVLNNYAYYLSIRKLNLEKAKKMSYKCNEIEPNNSTYEDTYAWILYQLKEYKLAKEWMIKSLKNGGNKSAVILEHYGDILFQLSDTENAIIYWKKAQEIGGKKEKLNKKISNKKLYE